MKKLLTMLLTVSLLACLCACGQCSHEFSAATCVSPATCKKCGATQGEPLGHDWVEATCTEPKTCLQCGATTGNPLGHKANHDATCTDDSVCTVCGKILDKAIGHKWEPATCVTLKTCSVCGETEGGYAEHDYDDATCIAPKTCKVCGATEGEVSNEHKWIDATCTEAKTCSLCGITEGTPLGHDYAPATCTKPRTCNRCGEKIGEPNGHRLGNWEVTVQATKDKAGTRVKKCSVCGEIVEQESFALTEKELLKQYKASCTISYNDLARSPENYKGEYVFFSGRVVQVCSEASSALYYSTYRVATNGRYDDVALVYIDNYGSGSRILEDDIISFYGKFDGLYTYTTVLGASITIPAIKAEVYCQGYVY